MKSIIGVVILIMLAASAARGQQTSLPDVQPLPLLEPIERTLAAKKAHFYFVELKRGEALRVDLAEKGVNCVVALLVKSDGKLHEVLKVNFGNGFDNETITYIAKEQTTHVIAVASGPDLSGTYRLTGAVSGQVRQAELRRADAVRSLAESIELWDAGTDKKRIDMAVQKMQDAFNLWKELKEDYWIAYTANRLGRIYTNLSQKEKAVEYLKLALELFRSIGDRRGESIAANNLGIVLANFGQHTEALEFFKASLPNRQEIGDASGQANVLTAIAAIHSSTGSQQLALEYYERALKILSLGHDQESQANTLSNIASLYIKAGEVSQALLKLNQALGLLDGTDDTSLRAQVLNELASAHHQLGEFEKSIEYHQQSLSLSQKSGNLQDVAMSYSNIGSIYSDLGELQEALRNTQKALAVYREIGDDIGAALSLHNLARFYAAVGDGRKMSDSLLEALALMKGKEAEHPELQVSLLLQSGDILSDHKDYEFAEKALLKALTLTRTIGDKPREAGVLRSLALVYKRAGTAAKALETYNEAYLVANSIRDSELAAFILSDQMVFWADAGNPQLAIFCGKTSLREYQQLRTNLRRFDRETQKSYLRKNEHTYIYLANLLIAGGRYAEALQVISASQDQQFYDFNLVAPTAAIQITLTAREDAFLSVYRQATERVVTLGQQLQELKRPVGNPTSPAVARQIAELAVELKTASEEFSAVLRRAAADFSTQQRDSESISTVTNLLEMQSILRELSAVNGNQTVALYPLIDRENFRILLVTPDSVVTAAAPVDASEFDRKVLQFHALLQSPAYDPRPLGKDLYDLIIKPVEPALRAAGARTLLWSLNGTLRYVPMASLWDGEHYLVERYQNVVFTRADRARMTRAVSRDWTGVGFGNSRAQSIDLVGNGNRVPFLALPGVPEELRAIFGTHGNGGVVKGNVFTDDRFTKASFFDLAKRRPALVHVASHFSFSPGDDTQSFLLLGDGTALTLNEIKRQKSLFEGVELLTLSACDTAALRPDAMGREIDGFAESAQRLGAGAVMATLWTVADNSTPRLMREFYRGRQSGGALTKAEALRRAQLTLLNGTPDTAAPPRQRVGVPAPVKIELVETLGTGNKRISRTYVRGAEVIYLEKREAPPFKADLNKPFAHPYYWAPFILIGNGR